MSKILTQKELAVPPPTPDVHRGRITGVMREDFDSGSTCINFGLESLDSGGEFNYRLFVPKAFVEDVDVDPESLPNEEGNKQLVQYRIGIANSEKNATVQNLLGIAQEEGREIPDTDYSDFDGYVEQLNQILSGMELVFTRTVDKNQDDPAFKNQLKVRGFYPKSAIDNPKLFKKFVKRWE